MVSAILSIHPSILPTPPLHPHPPDFKPTVTRGGTGLFRRDLEKGVIRVFNNTKDTEEEGRQGHKSTAVSKDRTTKRLAHS